MGIASDILYLVIRITCRIVRVLPESFVLYFAAIEANIVYFLLNFTPFRGFIQGNIMEAFGGRCPPRKINDIGRRHLVSLFKSLVEFMRLPAMGLDDMKGKVKAENIRHLDKALEEGKGVVLLTGHFGNWEMAAAYLGLKGYPIYAMYQAQSSRAINRWFNEARALNKVRTIRRWLTLRDVMRLLRGNCIVALLADQHGEFENVFAEFFGHRVSVPAGPVAFALKSGARIVPVFIIREKHDRHRLVFEPPLELTRTGDKQRDREENSQKYIRVFEKYISQYPDQWFWVYNRWDKLKK